MILSVIYAFLVALCAVVHGFPHLGMKSFLDASDLESSGTGADAPIQGRVKVVKVSPHFLRRPSALFRRGTALRNGPSRRGAFPAFLALGRPGPAQSHRGMPPSGPFQRLSNSAGVGEKRRQGQEMWQKALDKGSHGKAALALPINPKDTSKQSCAAVPFAQRVSAAGCEAVTVQNKLCFGQCSSLYVPPGGDSMADAGISSLCSRCGPSKVRSVTVPLRCRGSEVRERRVTLVEECKCETGSEEDSGEKTRRRGGQM